MPKKPSSQPTYSKSSMNTVGFVSAGPRTGKSPACSVSKATESTKSTQKPVLLDTLFSLDSFSSSVTLAMLFFTRDFNFLSGLRGSSRIDNHCFDDWQWTLASTPRKSFCTCFRSIWRFRGQFKLPVSHTAKVGLIPMPLESRLSATWLVKVWDLENFHDLTKISVVRGRID